jgi:[ribosomal protein S5]-alanine N-acetyltransferase
MADAAPIETARLLLRPMVAEDVEPLLGVFADPRVMAAFESEPFDRAAMERWVRRNLEHQARHGYGLFTVVLRESGLVVGDCGLEQMDVDGRAEAELGYDVRSDHWGRGLATEAARAVRDHAFGTLGMARLVSLVRTGNEASRRVAEKLGMAPEREIDRDGRAYWVYALSRPDRR